MLREKVKIALLLIIPVAILAAILGYVRWVGYRIPNPNAYRGQQLVVMRRLNADQVAGEPVTHITGQTWAEQKVIEAIRLFESHEAPYSVYVGDAPGGNSFRYFGELGLIDTPVEYNGNYYELTIMFADTFALFFFPG